jgi:hypothetical protein
MDLGTQVPVGMKLLRDSLNALEKRGRVDIRISVYTLVVALASRFEEEILTFPICATVASISLRGGGAVDPVADHGEGRSREAAEEEPERLAARRRSPEQSRQIVEPVRRKQEHRSLCRRGEIARMSRLRAARRRGRSGRRPGIQGVLDYKANEGTGARLDSRAWPSKPAQPRGQGSFGRTAVHSDPGDRIGGDVAAQEAVEPAAERRSRPPSPLRWSGSRRSAG